MYTISNVLLGSHWFYSASSHQNYRPSCHQHPQRWHVLNGPLALLLLLLLQAHNAASALLPLAHVSVTAAANALLLLLMHTSADAHLC
jgi:hypothetical protein